MKHTKINPVIFERSATLPQLNDLAAQLCQICFPSGISQARGLCIWLEGGMGAGKTSLCSQLLHHIGLEKHIPVTSPTYTYVNEYQIGPARIIHADLYRLPSATTLEELGVYPDQEYSVLFLEWAEKLAKDSLNYPDFILEIITGPEAGQRHYRLKKINQINLI